MIRRSLMMTLCITASLALGSCSADPMTDTDPAANSKPFAQRDMGACTYEPLTSVPFKPLACEDVRQIMRQAESHGLAHYAAPQYIYVIQSTPLVRVEEGPGQVTEFQAEFRQNAGMLMIARSTGARGCAAHFTAIGGPLTWQRVRSRTVRKAFPCGDPVTFDQAALRLWKAFNGPSGSPLSRPVALAVSDGVNNRFNKGSSWQFNVYLFPSPRDAERFSKRIVAHDLRLNEVDGFPYRRSVLLCNLLVTSETDSTDVVEINHGKTLSRRLEKVVNAIASQC